MGRVVLTVVFTALTAAPLAAQEAGEAEALEARAQGLVADFRDLDKAAGLLEKAGDLRLEGDPQGVSNLVEAGKLWFYEGKADRAARALAK
ncbi:MAG: hypothetical protein D6701_03360, partial [Gemmatimonadetes bacterium]